MQVPNPAVLSSEHQLLLSPVPTYGSIRNLSAQNYVQRVMNIFLDNDLVAPGHDHLELIARFAIEAQQRFFTVALYHPEAAELNHLFDTFVLLCASPISVS
jgi:hypothetical protein